MLYFIAWLTDFAALLFVFTGTRFLAERGAGALMLGWLGGAFFLASAISNACSGRIADGVGWRRVAVCGSLLFLANLTVVAAVPPSGWLFFAAYTGVGVSLGMIYPSVMAWLGHGRSGRAASRAYLFFCLAFNLGIVSAQLSGGWLFEQLGAQAPLLVAIALAAISFGCLVVLREPAASQAGSTRFPIEPEQDARLARAFARLTWMANFGGMFSMSMVWFLFPKLVVSLDVRADAHGVILAVGRVMIMCTYCVMHRFPFWQYQFPLAAAAQALGAAGLVTLAAASTPLGLSAGIAALSVLMGYNYFSSLYYNALGHTATQKGRAFGLNEAALGFGATGGSVLGGMAGADWGIRAPFQLAASLLAMLLVVQALAWWRFVRPLQSAHSVSSTESSPRETAAVK